MCGLLLALLISSAGATNVKTMKASEIPWFKNIKAAGHKEIFLCGSADIQNSAASIKKHFLTGGKGYFLTGLFSEAQYWRILVNEDFAAAKEHFDRYVKNAQLWMVESGKAPRPLGTPTKTEFNFKISVKDCVATGNHPLGDHCLKRLGNQRLSCCREKFPGLMIYWGEQRDFRLGFAPDPSVRLKVPGENNHRYCQVGQFIRIQD